MSATLEPKTNADIHIEPVTQDEQTVALAKLAKTIWEAHFTPIIGSAQVAYMLEHFQSAEAIQHQMKQGARYWVAVHQGQWVGYQCLISDAEKGKVMLSKLYVTETARGTGIGKLLLNQAETFAQQQNAHGLWLTVNRHNHAPIAWYQRQGFQVVDAQKNDIGHGFFMDDLIMEKPL